MTHLGFVSDGLPVPNVLLQQGSDGMVNGLFHAGILGKFSSKGKEHFTTFVGQPRPMTDGDSINRVLARNLAYWMGEAKLTQAALAEKAGVSQKTISNYLNPDQRVSGSKGKEPSAKLTELAKIADALAVGVWQLLRDMSESERALYASIERNYADMILSAKEVARKSAEQEAANQKALREAISVAHSQKPKKKAA